MPTWLQTILIAIAVLVAGELTVKPRLEARNRRIQAAHILRDQFAEHVFTVLTSCSRLQRIEIRRDMAPQVQTALRGERERARRNLDEASIWLADNVELYALSYIPQGSVRDMTTKYGFLVRMIYISPRKEEDRIRMINELTGYIHTIFFANIRHRLLHLNPAREKLVERLAWFEEDQPAK